MIVLLAGSLAGNAAPITYQCDPSEPEEIDTRYTNPDVEFDSKSPDPAAFARWITQMYEQDRWLASQGIYRYAGYLLGEEDTIFWERTTSWVLDYNPSSGQARVYQGPRTLCGMSGWVLPEGGPFDFAVRDITCPGL